MQGRHEMKQKIGMGMMLALYTAFLMMVFTAPLWR